MTPLGKACLTDNSGWTGKRVHRKRSQELKRYDSHYALSTSGETKRTKPDANRGTNRTKKAGENGKDSLKTKAAKKGGKQMKKDKSREHSSQWPIKKGKGGIERSKKNL